MLDIWSQTVFWRAEPSNKDSSEGIAVEPKSSIGAISVKIQNQNNMQKFKIDEYDLIFSPYFRNPKFFKDVKSLSANWEEANVRSHCFPFQHKDQT